MATKRQGTRCQACGAFRHPGLNGKLPPHVCAKPRPRFPSSSARRVIVDDSDDLLSSFIRQLGYGSPGLFGNH